MTLQITPPPLARRIGIACLVTSTSPKTLVSKSLRHTSAGITSTGRLSSLDARVVHEHAQARRATGWIAGSVTSSARDACRFGTSARSSPSRTLRMVAITSKPRCASSRDRLPIPGSRRSRLRSARFHHSPSVGPVTTPMRVTAPRCRIARPADHHGRIVTVPSAALDLRFTPEQERFRAEARAWLVDRLDGRVREGARPRRPGRRARAVRRAVGVGAGARPRRLDRARLAGRVRRPRRRRSSSR